MVRCGVGGKLTAAAAARFHPDVEAALLSAYRVDPLDAAVTLRRVWVLLRRLPPGTWPDPDEGASWSVEAYLLAGVLDAVNDVAWLTAAVNSKHQPKRPPRTPRPGRAAPKPEGLGSLMAAMKEVTG